MSERLTESERAEALVAEFEKRRGESMFTSDRNLLRDTILAARGAGDGLAGRVAALAAKWEAMPGVSESTADLIYDLTTELRALLDPDAQGADEGGSRG